MDSLIFQILIAVFSGGAIYGAIRMDLKYIHKKFDDHDAWINSVQSDVKATNARLDHILTLRHNKQES